MAAAEPTMTVTVVGCSGSVPGPAGPASCYLVQAQDRGRTWSIVLDLGNGSLGALQRYLDPLDLDAVLLSHLHADHCADIAGLYVMAKYRPEPPRPSGRITVHGPAAAAERLGRMYGARQAEDLGDVFEIVEVVDRQAFDIGPLRVEPVAVRHTVPAFGFRIGLAGGPTLAYTGDTDDCPALRPLMARADLVLADCASVDGRDTSDGVHLSASRAARAALDAGGVGTLVLTHLPPWNDSQVCRAQASAIWPGPLVVAEAGERYRVRRPESRH